MKKFIKEYLTFSRKETYAVIVILLLTTVFVFLPYFFSKQKAKEPLDMQVAKITGINIAKKDSVKKLADNEKAGYYSNNTKGYQATNAYSLHPFAFDPNMLNEDGWHKLGLPDKLIRTILNYRSKGGKFKNAEDIRKIWGLKKEDADILIPYITMEVKPNENKAFTYSSNKSYTKPLPQKIDVNTATVEEFKALPGVGNTAYKIIKFREKLGGFISISQVKETYGLSDSVYTAMLPYLQLISTEIQKVNINTADDYELSKHPYISREIAKAIIIYRNQHGNYSRIEDVRKIVFINQSMFQKIAPYITVL